MESLRTKVGEDPVGIGPLAFSVEQFCRAHSISRALFYLMQKDGRGPRIMKCGKRTLVAREAAEDWRRQMEASQ